MATLIWTSLALTLLFLLTSVSIVVGAISWSRSLAFFLPFPVSLSAISTLLPVATIILTLACDILQSRSQRSTTRRLLTASANGHHQQQRSAAASPAPITAAGVLSYVLDHVLTLAPGIIATLAATYISSDNSCNLEGAWQSYFRAKNANVLRSIQDSLQCCGLRSTHDRAWPFKDANHGDDACVVQLGYSRSCLTPWREKERGVAVMVFVAAVLVWGVKIGLLYLGPRGWTFNHTERERGYFHWAAVDEAQRIPRMLPYSDTPNGNANRDDEEVANQDLPVSDRPLLNPDAREVSDVTTRDLSGSSPWRDGN